MKRAKPRVFVICSVFNHLGYTKKMLASLKKQTYQSIETIIIDDGSTDGTAAYLKNYYPKITVLSGDGNLWWTAAMAWGVSETLRRCKKGDFIITMNNDCTFDRRYVSTLVAVSCRHNRAIVGSMAVDAAKPERIWDAGVRIDWSRGQFVTLAPSKKTIAVVDCLAARGTIIPVEVFKTIGNYHVKALPHYLADYEFSYRAKQAHFTTLISYQAKVYANVSRTGLGDTLPKQISYAELWQLLFARRSRLNIVDHLQWIRLACPPSLRLRNIGIWILKICYLASHVFPFVLLRPLAVRARQQLFTKSP